MEAKPVHKRSLSQASPSFRLRSTSLNSLRLRRIFDVFDSNGDGMITVEELRLALERLGLETDPAELDSTMQCYIKPGNMGIQFDDFESLHQSIGDSLFGVDDDGVDAACSSGDQEEADLSEAFKVFDEDGDGFINALDLQTVLSRLGLPEGDEIERVRQMIFSVDRNRDGRVDFHEFKDMMQNISVLTA